MLSYPYSKNYDDRMHTNEEEREKYNSATNLCHCNLIVTKN